MQLDKMDLEDLCATSAAKLAFVTELLCQLDYPNKPVKPDLSAKGLEGLCWFLSDIVDDLSRASGTETAQEARP